MKQTSGIDMTANVNVSDFKRLLLPTLGNLKQKYSSKVNKDLLSWDVINKCVAAGEQKNTRLTRTNSVLSKDSYENSSSPTDFTAERSRKLKTQTHDPQKANKNKMIS